MAKPIQSITVVGGGTSGWLTAAFFSAIMQNAMRTGELRITVIESPNIPIIGVGEATAPGLAHTFQLIGLNETEFIRQSNAAFKMSGYFDGWNVDGMGRPRRWINPFMVSSTIKGISPGYHYCKFGREGPDAEPQFTKSVSPCPDLIEQHKGPRSIGAGDYQMLSVYAYHMDATALAKQLCGLAKSRGVEHILDEVADVNLDERGFVASLELKEGGAYPIEFVIDATGFRGVIIQKALNEPFDPFDNYLVNDRAAVVQVPHENPTDIEPISRATALGAGWAFNVPLYNRVGTGYVFSSKFTSDEKAIAELKAHLGTRIGDKEPRIIPMRIGKSRRSWVKNCVAIGLSSGFAEPLEATAIHSVDLALRWLYAHFPDAEFNPALAKAYNRLIDEIYTEVIDFIVLHFYLNNRTDTNYWVAAREEARIPDSLHENLALWRQKMPRPSDLKSSHFFNANSYLAALMGKGFYDSDYPTLPGLVKEDWVKFVREQRAKTNTIIAQAPNHYALLRHIRGEDLSQKAQSPGHLSSPFNIPLN